MVPMMAMFGLLIGFGLIGTATASPGSMLPMAVSGLVAVTLSAAWIRRTEHAEDAA